MTEFKYCIYCGTDPEPVCFGAEADAMKFAREETNTCSSVRVEKTEIDEDGSILNSEVIWEASNTNPENFVAEDNPFKTEFPKSDIEEVEISDDAMYDEIAKQYEEGSEWPADADEPGRARPDWKKIKEAMEDNESEVECKCCFDLFPKETCIKTEDGYICKKCNQELHSHQGTNLDLIDADPFDLSYDDPRDPEEEEEPEIKDEPLDANEVRKHEAGIEETLEEHINDRPADIESEQEYQGVDNAVVDCPVATIIAHSEDEKPLDCEMKKPALEEPLAGKDVDIKVNEDLSEEETKELDKEIETLEEELKVIVDFSDYKPWSGAVDTYDLIRDADKLDDLEAYLEECYPDGITATQINDILWFDGDQVLSYLGLGDAEDEDEIDESLKEEAKDNKIKLYGCDLPNTLLDDDEWIIIDEKDRDLAIELDNKVGEILQAQVDEKGELDPDFYNVEEFEKLADEAGLEWEFGATNLQTENLEEAKKDDELPVDPEAAKLEVHTMLNDLVADEIEAINGYEEAKKEILDAPINHKDAILDTVDHIEDEEKEHVDELIDATTEIPFDKEEAPAPVVEEPVVEEPVVEEPVVEEPVVEEGFEDQRAKTKKFADEVNAKKSWKVSELKELAAKYTVPQVDYDYITLHYNGAIINENLNEDPFDQSFPEVEEKLEERAMADTPFDSDVKVGDKIRIVHLEGEDNSYDGKEGEVEHIDSIGQLHGTWGGLAIIPGVDDFDIITEGLTEPKYDIFDDGQQIGQIEAADEEDAVNQCYNGAFGRSSSDNLFTAELAEESLTEAKAKPEADKVQCYNDGLKLAKAYNKPVIYGYTNSSYDGKFFKLDDPIICDNVSDETKKFKQQYKSCNVAYVAYPSGQLVESLLEDTNSNEHETFTAEEQEEYNCDEDGNCLDSYDTLHHCGWCGDVFTEYEMRHEADFGWICSRCEDELKSHGGPLTFIENEGLSELTEAKRKATPKLDIVSVDESVQESDDHDPKRHILRARFYDPQEPTLIPRVSMEFDFVRDLDSEDPDARKANPHYKKWFEYNYRAYDYDGNLLPDINPDSERTETEKRMLGNIHKKLVDDGIIDNNN